MQEKYFKAVLGDDELYGAAVQYDFVNTSYLAKTLCIDLNSVSEISKEVFDRDFKNERV